MNDLERESDRLADEARTIIERLGLFAAWNAVGAEAHIVGSLATGLMMKHRDIDLHVYPDPLDAAASFRAVAAVAAVPGVRRAQFVNLINTDEACLEWHLFYGESPDAPEWQIDMIAIRRRSRYDGYFERVAQRIRDVLTPESRRAILALKARTPDAEKITGIEYYQAVLRDDVRDWDEFVRWRNDHPAVGVVEWMP